MFSSDLFHLRYPYTGETIGTVRFDNNENKLYLDLDDGNTVRIY